MSGYDKHEPAQFDLVVRGIDPVDTKIICTCKIEFASWLAFYRHRGDQYAAQLADQ